MSTTGNATHTTIFMALIFIIGVILTIVSWDIDNKLQNVPCESSSLKTSNKLVLCIGITFIVSAMSFYGCSNKCSNAIVGLHYTVYIIAIFLLGILLIVLGSIISAASTAECSNTGNPASIWGLGVIMVLSSITYFYSQYKDGLL
jgi:hypothetical protein